MKLCDHPEIARCGGWPPRVWAYHGGDYARPWPSERAVLRSAEYTMIDCRGRQGLRVIVEEDGVEYLSVFADNAAAHVLARAAEALDRRRGQPLGALNAVVLPFQT